MVSNIKNRHDMNKVIKLLLFAVVSHSLSSCSKDDPSNTSHPDEGAVVVTTDWNARSSDAVLPDNYILRIGAQEQTVSGVTNAFHALFLPGEQELLVYHQAEGITISENTATVNTLSDGTLEPLPGYLFSASRKLEIVKDDTLKVTVPMQQYIRRLTLSLQLKPGDEQRIAHTAATLTGIASTIDLTTGAITSTEGKTVIPTFALQTDGSGTRAAGQPQLKTALRLLGVVTAEKQILTIDVTLHDGSVQTITTDLTDMLKNFGSDMEPLELNTTLELPTAAGMSATITGWNVIDNGEVGIH